MAVGLAAETLSRSASTALDYLMKHKYAGFSNCGATSRYALMFNDLFDIFNTGWTDTKENNSNNMLKVPLCMENSAEIFSFFDVAVDYIESLQLDGKSILNSTRKTGFLGFLINITMLKSIYEEYVITGKIQKIPTFQLSQDPLESFFGRIRSRCGCNDNPTVQQFKSAYRKILINKEINSSSLANCKDKLCIYFVASTSKDKRLEMIDSTNDASGERKENQLEKFSANDNLLDIYSELTICQIASDIEQKILNIARFDCELRMNVFDENDKIPSSIIPHALSSPCISTVHLCKIAKIILDIYKTEKTFRYSSLLENTQMEIDLDNIYAKSDFSLHEEEGHLEFIIDFVIDECIRINAKNLAKKLTLIEKEKLLKTKKNKQLSHIMGH